MSLIKRKKDLSRFPEFSDFFSDDWLTFGNGESKLPATNVVENEKNFEIEIAAPGFNKSDFDVSVENGVLTISGKTEKEEEEKKKNFTRKEFSSQSFSKSFTLPDNIEEEGIDAKYTDGILHLTVNKSDKQLAEKKKVAIK